MVPPQRAAGQRSNQSTINQGIRKVIGSSNRGFASLDPERQRALFGPQPPAQDGGKASVVMVPPVREAGGNGGSASGLKSAATVQDRR